MSTYNHPVPAIMLVQIGDMTVSFGHLEFHLQTIFGYLIDQRAPIGRSLASYLSFSNLRAAVVTLYELCFELDERYDELRELLKEAAKIEQERNTITHSYWFGGNAPDTITRHKVIAREKSGFNAQFQDYTESDLSQLNYRIKSLSAKIAEFYGKLPSKRPDMKE